MTFVSLLSLAVGRVWDTSKNEHSIMNGCSLTGVILGVIIGHSWWLLDEVA